MTNLHNSQVTLRGCCFSKLITSQLGHYWADSRAVFGSLDIFGTSQESYNSALGNVAKVMPSHFDIFWHDLSQLVHLEIDKYDVVCHVV
jgi:hypothetical protein